MLAVDNLSGSRIGKRTVKVDHVLDYKKKKAEVSCCADRLCTAALPYACRASSPLPSHWVR